MIRYLRNGAVFLAVLGLSCWFVGRFFPLPEVEEVSAKLDELRNHPGEFDTLFLGSSRIYHQIIPAEFDALTAQAGRPTKSFNAAVDGMRQPELNFFVEELLRCHLRGLKQVFIESGSITAEIAPDRRDTLRGVYWHDLPRMGLVLRAAWAEWEVPRKGHLWRKIASVSTPLSDIRDHLAPFARRFSNLGRASVITRTLLKEAPMSRRAELGPAGDGFLEANRPPMTAGETAQYEKGLAKRLQHETVIHYSTSVSQESFNSILEAFKKVGASPILIIPPTLNFRKFHLRPLVEQKYQVLDYSDPRKYAELYETRYRLDGDHINTAGAEVFTQLVARDFCAAAKIR